MLHHIKYTKIIRLFFDSIHSSIAQFFLCASAPLRETFNNGTQRRKNAKVYKVVLSCLIGGIMLSACGNSESQEGEQDVKQNSSAVSENEPRAITDSRRSARLVTGPEHLVSERMDLLEGKRVGIIGNHTSLLPGGVHLVDTLRALGVNIVKVFSPEHGFRGTADAGEKVSSGVDEKTGLPLVSLYGKSRKPSPEQLADLDVVIFDIQDVGSRHYTYIGTMSYAMEACAENGKKIIVLDRPNPNGWYVDGPMMEDGHNSFIGMHSIPIAHGMTVGEYARMVNKEGWLKDGVTADLEVVTCKGYTHSMTWEDTKLEWIAPSPNLGTEYASYLYPAICWLEPTPVSVGRGTDDAFTIVGAPWYQPLTSATARTGGEVFDYYGLEMKVYDFTPVSLPGKSKYPKLQDKLCHGVAFQNRVDGKSLFLAGIQLISELYRQSASGNVQKNFFGKRFSRWAGQTILQQQITEGIAPEEIWESWQPSVTAFKDIRSRYLLYPDFE